MVHPAAGSPDEWRVELGRLIEFRDSTEDPESKLLLTQLIDELIAALANPDHPINTHKEIG